MSDLAIVFVSTTTVLVVFSAGWWVGFRDAKEHASDFIGRIGQELAREGIARDVMVRVANRLKP